MTTEWRNTTKYVVGIGIAAFGLLVLYISRPLITPLILGALIAFLVRPLIRFFSRRLRFPRGLAVLVTYLIATVVLILAPLILVPPIITAAEFLFLLDYQTLLSDGIAWVQLTLGNWQYAGVVILGIPINLNGIINPILNFLENLDPGITPELPSLQLIFDSLTSAVSVTYGVATNLIGWLISLIFLILASIYISLDGPRFYRGFIGIFPPEYHIEINTLFTRLRIIWEAFFRGQVTLMIIIGVTVWIGLTILGVPGAFALGVLAGLLEVLPNLGPVLATIPAAIIALLQGSLVLNVSNLVFMLIVIGFYILVQMFENYIIVPRVLGGAVQLHPLVVMTGVLIGAATWGILGALLAAPLIASAREILLYFYAKILGEEPFTADLIGIPKGEEVPGAVPAAAFESGDGDQIESEGGEEIKEALPVDHQPPTPDLEPEDQAALTLRQRFAARFSRNKGLEAAEEELDPEGRSP